MQDEVIGSFTAQWQFLFFSNITTKHSHLLSVTLTTNKLYCSGLVRCYLKLPLFYMYPCTHAHTHVHLAQIFFKILTSIRAATSLTAVLQLVFCFTVLHSSSQAEKFLSFESFPAWKPLDTLMGLSSTL